MNQKKKLKKKRSFKKIVNSVKNENKKILNEYQNKLEKLEKREDDYITKFDKLIKILEEMKNNYKEVYYQSIMM